MKQKRFSSRRTDVLLTNSYDKPRNKQLLGDRRNDIRTAIRSRSHLRLIYALDVGTQTKVRLVNNIKTENNFNFFL